MCLFKAFQHVESLHYCGRWFYGVCIFGLLLQWGNKEFIIKTTNIEEVPTLILKALACIWFAANGVSRTIVVWTALVIMFYAHISKYFTYSYDHELNYTYMIGAQYKYVTLKHSSMQKAYIMHEIVYIFWLLYGGLQLYTF